MPVICSFFATLAGLPLILISCTISCTNNIFSIMLLPLTNPACWGEMIVGNRWASLSCRILENILLLKLLKLIGLMSENVMIAFFLGNNTRLVHVTYLGRSCPQKKECTIDTTSSSIISQQYWQNFSVKPSGPPVLSAFRPNTALFTSSISGISWISLF